MEKLKILKIGTIWNLVYLLILKNIGLTKSLNKLIKNTKGELIARQDSDDYSNPERIYTQVRYLLKNNLDAVTSRALIIGSTKKIQIQLLYPSKTL